MAGTPRHWDWARLADHVVSRRAALGMSRDALADATGVSARSIGKMERGESVSRDTVAKVEIALGWEQGSGRRLLEGGEPSEAARPAPAAGSAYRVILDAPGLTEGERLAAIAAIEEERRRTRERYARAGYTEEQQRLFEAAPEAFRILVERERARRAAEDEANGASALPGSGDRPA
jgi:transcriptional regulator with XRE-family HTH domain